jgi:hypothetical protein
VSSRSAQNFQVWVSYPHASPAHRPRLRRWSKCAGLIFGRQLESRPVKPCANFSLQSFQPLGDTASAADGSGRCKLRTHVAKVRYDTRRDLGMFGRKRLETLAASSECADGRAFFYGCRHFIAHGL